MGSGHEKSRDARELLGRVNEWLGSGRSKEADEPEDTGAAAQLEEANRRAAQFRKQRDEARTQRDEARRQRDEARASLQLAGGELSVEAAVLESSRRKRAEERHKAFPVRHVRVGDQIAAFFEREGLRGGRLLEIGGRENPYHERFGEFEYTHLDLTETGPDVIVGDITSCPHIADASFDAIISVDVFEHIDRPWLAAGEIGRLLTPGGLTYHSTLFSWRYHPCPIDYWRYTPDALRFLFAELECVECDFDDLERRRDIYGKGKNKLAPDEFGGWRENWRVFFAGRKPR